MNDAAEPTDVVVCAAGGMPGDLLKLWRPLDPKGYHVEYGFSCMGYEIAGGLGVKLADPDREVFVMVGDGSYLMMNTELVTSLARRAEDRSGRCGQFAASSAFAACRCRAAPHRLATSCATGIRAPIAWMVSWCRSISRRTERAWARQRSLPLPHPSWRPLSNWPASKRRSTVIHVRVDKDIRVPGYRSWWDVPIAEVSGQEGVQECAGPPTKRPGEATVPILDLISAYVTFLALTSFRVPG